MTMIAEGVVPSHLDLVEDATDLVAMLEGLELAVSSERLDFEVRRALQRWTALAADKASLLKASLEARVTASG